MGSTLRRRECQQGRRCTESEDPDGIKGITEEFIVCLARAVKDAQQEKIHCYYCRVLAALYLQLPIGEVVPNRLTFKPKGGDGTKEGSPGPSRKSDHAKGTPRRDAQDIGHHAQTPFLNPDPYHQWYGIKNLARVRVNQRELHGPPQITAHR